MAYRFVHAADIHLDSPLRSLALRNADLADLIGNATRAAFVRTIDLCIDEAVNALVIAGDLYDGDQTSMKTARFLSDQFSRLDAAGIATFIIRGNHDALSRITRELTLPDSVKLFGGRAEAFAVDRDGGAFPVVIHGLSFAQAQAPESLLGKYRPPIEGAVNIGLMHTSLAGAPGHDLYAPCRVADLQSSGFAYWALGHIHKRATYGGASTIVMPGIPQGRDINEAGAKSVTLVTIADDRSVTIEERPTAVAQFERLAVDATGMTDWRQLLSAVSAALEAGRAGVGADHLVARLTLTGATPLAWRMRRDADILLTEAEARAAGFGNAWIDRFEIAAHMPETKAASTVDPVDQLRRLIDVDVLDTEAFAAEAIVIADELRSQLPVECRAMLGTDDASARDILLALAREGAEDVLARLQAASASSEAN
jgi:DNA repair exonuclease SbcCD nuclease subunit